MVEDMFEISVEPAQDVIVEFDIIFLIKEKLMRLCSNRRNVELEEMDGKLIYRNRVSVMYDLAAYFRNLGYYCKVIAPIELRNMMIDSARKILDSYKELEQGK